MSSQLAKCHAACVNRGISFVPRHLYGLLPEPVQYACVGAAKHYAVNWAAHGLSGHTRARRLGVANPVDVSLGVLAQLLNVIIQTHAGLLINVVFDGPPVGESDIVSRFDPT